jgi:urease accessory protein
VGLDEAGVLSRREASTAGRGEVVVEGVHGRSTVFSAYATSPLRFLTPRNHGRAAWIYTSSHGGGFVDGDHVRMRLTVGPGAVAFVSTQAATKVYRSPRGTSAETEAHVAERGVLVVAPDPIVCFARSRYRQVQQFDLAEDSALVLVDWITSGRRAHGERWLFEEYLSRIVVRVEDRLLLHDVLSLRAADGDIAARMGRFNVLAAIAIVGPTLGLEASALVARIGATPVNRRADCLLAAASIGDTGCFVRIAGTSVESVGRSIRDYLAFLPVVLGDDPWKRKW